MSYTKLGTYCLPKTQALTSNAKYILPGNPVYEEPVAYTPCNSSSQHIHQDINNTPGTVKAFTDKKRGCPNCKSWY